MTVISLPEFEDEELLAVKPTRSAAEYCWTSTPSVILYCLKNYRLDACTYLDADMWFYSNPADLIEEMGDDSILLTEHRYTAEYYHTSGIYCVQFMCFKNTREGMTALKWWRDRCLEWCYAREEDGKFGDQKYLDDWTTRFTGVHVLKHEGGGLAPWNIQQYDLLQNDTTIRVKNKKTGKEFPVVFFHFHGLRFYLGRKVLLSSTLYYLSGTIIQHFYLPYIHKLLDREKVAAQTHPDYQINEARSGPPSGFAIVADYIKNRLILLKIGNISLFSLKPFSFARHYYLFDLKKI